MHIRFINALLKSARTLNYTPVICSEIRFQTTGFPVFFTRRTLKIRYTIHSASYLFFFTVSWPHLTEI